MPKIKIKIAPLRESYTPSNDDYIGESDIDFGKPKIKLTRLQKIVILTVLSHDFLKANSNEFADQLDQFSNALNGLIGPTALATKYGYTTAELLEIKNDAAYFRYWYSKHGAGAIYAKAWVDKEHEARKGTGPTPSAWPVGTPITSPPTDVAPGLEKRFRTKAKKAKDQVIYVPADGVTMGIEASSTPFNPAIGKPDLKITLSAGGHPNIDYLKSGWKGINIYKNSNDGKGWVFLHTCNDPSFADLSPLPAVGVSAAWIYKGIYLFGGQEVATMSNDVTVTVLGLV